MTRVMTFYRFARLDGLEGLQKTLKERGAGLGLKGTILLAGEGVNGTLSGSADALASMAETLAAVPALETMPFRYSEARPGNPVFYRFKVRIKPEIVALGRPGVDPAARTGTHVDAGAWNRLLDDPHLLVIDTRNRYEISVGTFPGAVDPGTTSFKQFPDYVARIDPAEHPRVAMFCTGGVRCEKASAYMLDQGFQEVYQLDGGILRYLETVDPEENRWSGECFVFDQRVSVDGSLTEGSFEQCFACRSPLTEEDRASPDYVQGISCPHCADELDPARRAAFQERQRQVELARRRGDLHVRKRMREPAAAKDPQRSSRGSR